MTGSPTAAAQRYRDLLVASTRETLTRERALRRSGAAADLAAYPVPLTTAEIDRMVRAYEAKLRRRTARVRKADDSTPIEPIRAPRAAERAYARALRHQVLNPAFRRMRAGLADAYAAAQLLAALDGMPPPNLGTLPQDLADEHLERLSRYHRGKLVQTFREALGVDIRPILQDAAISQVLAERMRDNVQLITSIPQRLNDTLYDSIRRTFADRPFDQQALAQVLQRGYRTVGYQTRRIARDQTTKTIGQLTEARNRELGVSEYVWRTAQDERVRPTHQVLNGTTQRWDRPPAVGHPGWDIQCRCVALPVIAGTRWASSSAPKPPVQHRPPKTTPAVEEFTPEKIPETGLGSGYTVETDALITALGGADPRSAIGRRRVADFVLQRGRADGTEHMALVDLVDGSVHAGTSGSTNSVSFVGSIDSALRDVHRRIVLYHNHPRSTGLSDADIGVLGTRRGMARIETLGHNGSDTAAWLPEAIRNSPAHGSTDFWGAAVNLADDAVRMDFLSRISSGIMSPAMASQMHSDTVNRLLAEVGAINYTSNIAPVISDVSTLASPALHALVEGLT